MQGSNIIIIRDTCVQLHNIHLFYNNSNKNFKRKELLIRKNAKSIQFQKFQTALGKISVFKASLIKAQAFEAGDFLNIFLGFRVF